MAIRQGKSPYCMAWLQIKSAQKAVQATRVYENIDAAERAARQFAKSIVADSRKLQDMKDTCPDSAAEVTQIAGSPPQMISDPAHDLDAMERWLKTLSPEQIADLKQAIKGYKAPRK